jgi:colanic acid biosynthesis protein WcaH
VKLEKERFLQVIDATPLVSIDLLVFNERNEVLLGRRINKPAQGFWFVPGGRILKNERVAEALKRISLHEIGVSPSASELVGVYDHIYADNFADAAGINTHYVVIAFKFSLPSGASLAPDPQHSDLKWWRPSAILTSEEVHENTRAYFKNTA